MPGDSLVSESARSAASSRRLVPSRASATRWRWLPHLGRLLVLVTILPGCSEVPPPIVVDADRITVFNRTNDEWTKVEVRVNQYYVATADSLAPDGRLDVPLTRLQGGFGRYFDPARERVRSVMVTGTGPRGAPVRLEWKVN